jgi:hypothetical protein
MISTRNKNDCGVGIGCSLRLRRQIMQTEKPTRTWNFFGERKGKSFETGLASLEVWRSQT